MPKSLLGTVDLARDETFRTGRLAHHTRHAIRSAMDEADPRAWSRAELSAARRVLSIWFAEYDTMGPFRILDRAAEALSSGRQFAMLEHELDAFAPIVEESIIAAGNSGQFAPSYAGSAVLAAGYAVLGQHPAVDAASDYDLDPQEWDASFYAALAWAGDRQDASTAGRLQEFWLWYLDSAIPAAIQGEYTA